jgi:uncharacterized protein
VIGVASTSQDLFAAIGRGDVEAIRRIVDQDPSLARARDSEGVSALMRARYRSDRVLAQAVAVHVPARDRDVFEASTFGDLDRLVELLAEDPARSVAFSGDGFTPLHLTAFFGRLEAALLLVDRGADVDARGRGFMTGTPLNSAAAGSHIDIVRLLLESGAEPDARQEGGFTALHAAAQHGNAELTRLLLEAGSDPTSRTDEGKTPAAFAEESGDADTIALLREAND